MASAVVVILSCALDRGYSPRPALPREGLPVPGWCVRPMRSDPS